MEEVMMVMKSKKGALQVRESYQEKLGGENKNPAARNLLSAWGRTSWTCTSWAFLIHIKGNSLSRETMHDENMVENVIYSGLECGNIQ